MCVNITFSTWGVDNPGARNHHKFWSNLYDYAKLKYIQLVHWNCTSK